MKLNETEDTRGFDQPMDAERWQKIKNLFAAAQEIAPGKRSAFLKKACADDAELRGEVEKLLASFDSAQSFMEKVAATEVASIIENKRTLIASGAGKEATNGKFVAGTVLANRYRIVGMLGRGGMGEVFKAEDIKLNQTVALKFLPDTLEKDPAALERFHAEVRIARQVAHKNVCRVFDIGEIENRHFISMEFIDGDDLSSLLRRIGRLPSDKATEIARQLCFGLAAIHDAGILHRDLKPANVIVDSRGKARITDFGIAGLETESKSDEMCVGTPAYMSPEQITGIDVSPKSDLYSLGLVLYEIFTGKKAFQADSMRELLQKQQTTSPTNPSEFLKDIDPIVERTILQCLEKNPADRPKNALQVALMLPGGNPLAAAIAAGETPSPEMVAAAPKKGSLKPVVALACLASVVALFAFIVFFAGRVKHHEWLPLKKSPEVLAERADLILKQLGYAEKEVDTDYGVGEKLDYYAYASQERDAPDAWERIRSGQPAIIYFWHRTSPRYLEPTKTESVAPDDPPNDVAGMTRMILDARGRLLEFQAVPPQIKTEIAAPTGEVDWTAVFAEAGLDVRAFRQTAANWTPPVFADTLFSWEGAHVDHAEIKVRIEAAAFQGKPVYFHIVAPWDKPARQMETSATAPVRAATALLIMVFVCIIVGGVFLARYNVLRGRSDTRGAFKITIFVFLMTLAAGLLVADHIPDIAREQPLLSRMAGVALFNAALIGLIYLALEPYVRRHWASLIISWNRLLAGDFKDPLVGRDVLIGGIFGLAHTATIYLLNLLQGWAGATPAPNPSLAIACLQGFRHFLASSIMQSADGVFIVFNSLLLLVLLVTIFRKRWLAIIVYWTLIFSILALFFAAGGHWAALFGPAFIAALGTVCIARFGLLASVSNYFFFFLSFHNPITTDVSRWYFGNTVFAGVALLGLAIYGFYTSLAGQKIFQSDFLKEDES